MNFHLSLVAILLILLQNSWCFEIDAISKAYEVLSDPLIKQQLIALDCTLAPVAEVDVRSAYVSDFGQQSIVYYSIV